MWILGSNPGLLDQYPALLTAEPSLQPPPPMLNINMCMCGFVRVCMGVVSKHTKEQHRHMEREADLLRGCRWEVKS